MKLKDDLQFLILGSCIFWDAIYILLGGWISWQSLGVQELPKLYQSYCILAQQGQGSAAKGHPSWKVFKPYDPLGTAPYRSSPSADSSVYIGISAYHELIRYLPLPSNIKFTSSFRVMSAKVVLRVSGSTKGSQLSPALYGGRNPYAKWVWDQ